MSLNFFNEKITSLNNHGSIIFSALKSKLEKSTRKQKCLFLCLGAGIFWAFWYDLKRRSRKDYKQNLVEKRVSDLLDRRIAHDPYHLVKSLDLIRHLNDEESKDYAQSHYLREYRKCLNGHLRIIW